MIQGLAGGFFFAGTVGGLIRLCSFIRSAEQTQDRWTRLREFCLQLLKPKSSLDNPSAEQLSALGLPPDFCDVTLSDITAEPPPHPRWRLQLGKSPLSFFIFIFFILCLAPAETSASRFACAKQS